MKRTGTRAGVPDIFWPVARGRYHGLFIEMKRAGVTKPSKEQAEWIEALEAQGYCCRVCSGCADALAVAQAYDALDSHPGP
jgi:VRR-NUC domain